MVETIGIKLSDYVAEFIANQGVKTVFALSGGASLHLIHSIADCPDLQYICNHHEQSAAMAADGYARIAGDIGVAVTTSGPGATNLVTGICCSYYDSVPVLFITGQVSTHRMTGQSGVRQIGFQETPTVDICRGITKYSVQILEPTRIRYELEKALFIARTGRPGPVLLDIPDDVQRMIVEPKSLPSYQPTPPSQRRFSSFKEASAQFFDLLSAAKRPVLIGGWGLHISRTAGHFVKLAQQLNIPVARTWGAADILPASHPLYIGTFGTHGMRHANFAVQNADLIVSLGSRLDTKATGSPIVTFARNAKKIILDIDPSELAKFSNFGLSMDLLIEEDLVSFFSQISNFDLKPVNNDTRDWINQIAAWKSTFDDYDRQKRQTTALCPYECMEELSLSFPENARIFIDTGCAIAWSMQSFKLNSSHRVFHDFNNTAMGWALPAAIGAFFADPSSPYICVIGDGAFMMTMQELATVKHHDVPIKIFILNNSGYSMIKQTQDQWLDSVYHASSKEGGVSFPDFKKLADSFGVSYAEISSRAELSMKLPEIFRSNEPILINIIVPPEARVVPQVKYGRPNEDMEPLLPRSIFLESMIIDPLTISKE